MSVKKSRGEAWTVPPRCPHCGNYVQMGVFILCATCKLLWQHFEFLGALQLAKNNEEALEEEV